MEILNSVVTLKPGIYILRHPQGGLAPLSVGLAPGGQPVGRLERIFTPGTQGTLLRDASDCIVVHVSEAPVDILVSAFLARKGDPVPQLRLDRIDLNVPASPVAPASTAPATRELHVPAQGISLIGHIERNGDVVAPPSEPLGDAALDLRVEGFQLVWPDRPEGVDLAYGISVEGAGALPVVKTGKFCGTRGEARRITEVTFALIGPKASAFRLEGSAHFTGGFSVPIRSGVTLSGPSGLEHLTSLKLQVVSVGATKPENLWLDPDRTKVFSSRQDAVTD